MAIPDRASTGEADSPIRVLVTADAALHREGLAAILAGEEALEVIEAASVQDAATAACELRPDVVILDLGPAAGREATRVLVSAVPDLRIIATCVSETNAELISWVEAGASGYVTPDASTQDLVAAVRAVAIGECPCSPAAAGLLVRRVSALAKAAASQAASGRLTPREREIVELISRGCANKEIARRLHVELHTVKNHVSNILNKLGVSTRGEAAAQWLAKPAELEQTTPVGRAART